MNAEVELKDGTTISNRLNLVDLAGSERADKSGTSGDKKAMKETQNINLSLTTLGKVINEIAAHAKVMSFRESELTKILKSSLLGNSKTFLVCTMSRKEINTAETWSTLQFAIRAAAIKLKAVRNIKLTVEQLEKLLENLQKEIKAYVSSLGKEALGILEVDLAELGESDPESNSTEVLNLEFQSKLKQLEQE